jgi:FAD/FMN-containing dehydrogenase
MTDVHNYGRTFVFAPRALEYPETAADLARVVKGATKLRVVGTGHSWSTGIVTGETLVSLDRMNRLVAVDRGALRVTVEAGIKLKNLIAQLEEHGLALANLGSIAEQSLAGAISTGTHGTGMAFQCLAAQVEGLRLVDGAGNERALLKGDPDFDAVVVGLGCFGVIYEVTLSVVPAYQMHAVTDLAPFDEVVQNLDSYVRGFDHFKFWWLVPEDDLVVFKHRRTDEPRRGSDFVRWFRDEFLAVTVYRWLIALERLDRERLVPFVNKQMARQVGKHWDRVCKSHVGFLTPDPPVHRETEWAFDYADAKRLLREYRATLLESGHTYNFIQEIRFTKGDDFWLSPAYRRDSIWLGMYNMDSPDRWNDQLARFEAFATRNGGRPHWGKEASFDPTYLATQWAKLGDFGALARSYDPEDKLVNAWVSGLGLRKPPGRQDR